MTERTLVLVKPDGVARGLGGTILATMEARGLTIVALKLMRVSRELAERHYEEHRGKPFYGTLVDFITSGPVVAAAVEGAQAVAAVRHLAGATDPLKADPGSIRGRYGLHIGRNLIHASDSPASAARELKLWFRDDEIVPWTRPDASWLTESR